MIDKWNDGSHVPGYKIARFARLATDWSVEEMTLYRIPLNVGLSHTKNQTLDYTPRKQNLGGVYRNRPVRPSMYLVSATTPKRLIGFL